MDSKRVVLVTGAAGFLGSHIVQKLLEIEHARHTSDNARNHIVEHEDDPNGSSRRVEKLLSQAVDNPITELRAFDVRPFNLESLELPFSAEDAGVQLKSVVGSVASAKDLTEALVGVSEVYHVASVVDSQARHFVPKLLQAVNVDGVRLLLKLSKAAGVKRFVYTSSFTVASGWTDANEYPTELSKFLGGAYGYTKSIAEKDVLAANSSEMHTLSLRPIAMFGERDHQDMILDSVKRSRTFVGCVRFGGGGTNPRLEHSYAPNVAFAHICGMNALRRDPESCGGKAYWAKDDTEASCHFEWVKPYVEATGGYFPPADKYTPIWVIMYLAYFMEFFIRLISVFGIHIKTIITPVALSIMVVNASYDDKETRTLLGYEPLYSPKESFERTKHDLLTKVMASNDLHEL